MIVVYVVLYGIKLATVYLISGRGNHDQKD